MRKNQTPDTTTDTRRERDDRGFAILTTILFASALFVGAVHHEMWRDEIVIWMYGRGIQSVADLVRIIAYEPHPALWYLCVLAVAKISTNPVSIQMLNLLIATCATYVFLRYAPLPRLQKGLFVFGFFPFFEYGIICRAYALGLLLTYLFCALFQYRRTHLVRLSCMLFLLTNTSAVGLLLAVALGLTLLAAWHYDKRMNRPWHTSPGRAITAVVIVALGVLLSVLQIASASGVGLVNNTGHAYFHFSPVETVTTLAVVYLYNFGQIPLINGIVFSLVLLALSILSLRRQPIALFAYLTSTALMLGAVYFKQITFLWHLGYLFIAFIVGQWLAAGYALSSQQQEPTGTAGPSSSGTAFQSLADTLSRWFVYAILVCQLIPCAYAVYLDYTQPYSCGKAVAGFIMQNGMENLAVAGNVYYTTQTVSGYLGRPVYYLSLGKDGVLSWFGDYLPPDEHKLDGQEYTRRIGHIGAKERSGVLLVLSYPLSSGQTDYLGATYVKAFDNSVGGFIQSELACTENYWLYMVPWSEPVSAGK